MHIRTLIIISKLQEQKLHYSCCVNNRMLIPPEWCVYGPHVHVVCMCLLNKLRSCTIDHGHIIQQPSLHK